MKRNLLLLTSYILTNAFFSDCKPDHRQDNVGLILETFFTSRVWNITVLKVNISSSQLFTTRNDIAKQHHRSF